LPSAMTYEIVVGCKRPHSTSKNKTMGIDDTKQHQNCLQ
jgi:hypothetical protein